MGVEWREKHRYQKERTVTGSNHTTEKTKNSSILTFKGYDFENLVLGGFSFFGKLLVYFEM